MLPARRLLNSGGTGRIIENGCSLAHKDQSDVWWVFLLEGIAAIIFGILLITNPASTLVALVIFLGFYWLFVGVLELVRVFVDSSVPWYWSLLIGVLGIVAGIIVLRHPLFAAIVLPTAIVVWLGVLGLVIGVFAMIGGFTGGGVGSFIFGFVNFVIGLILLGSPMVAALAVPLVFGILLLVQGVVLIIWAFKVRR
ncbi:hypothetical protein AUC71_08940 [Methyloceanibacter marginalis]|uniref:HdeD protein n=1 Tax=Methyloceanibacter marginalis TaxID=1774971 RepID=A0A1E3WCP3_9HYPH|nr:hypothetical protein AUC71_08940 [Methyloceanibacter marginalis]